jgi:hypothetical protein
MKISNPVAAPEGMVNFSGSADDVVNTPFRGQAVGTASDLVRIQPNKLALLKDFAMRNRTALGSGLGLAAGLGAGAGLASIGRNNSMPQY